MMSYNEPEAIQTVEFNSILTNTFFRMFLGLLASSITAFYAYYSGIYVKMIEGGTFVILAIAEVVVVLVFSLLFKKLSPTVVTILYYAYAFLNGFTLSVLFAVYELSSIGITFLASSALFGILAFIGYKTNKDLSQFGTILIYTLLVGVVLTIVNIFLKSPILNIFLDWAILFVFFGLTIYDMNKIKKMQAAGICEDEKLYVYGAMELYLDFINIFLRLLSIFGKRRN